MKTRPFVQTVCLAALAGLLVVQFTGCGRSARGDVAGRPKLYAVSGVVKLSGQPVVGATVTFHSVDGGRAAVGLTDAEGRFDLTTFQRSDGAVAGTHRVAISKFQQEGPAAAVLEDDPAYDNPRPAQQRVRSVLPAKYAQADTSGLTATVVTSGKNEVSFELK